MTTEQVASTESTEEAAPAVAVLEQPTESTEEAPAAEVVEPAGEADQTAFEASENVTAEATEVEASSPSEVTAEES
jgi:hypothetical protein